MPEPKANILVVFYSRDGSVEALAKAVSEGARDAEAEVPPPIGLTEQANHQYDLRDFWTAAIYGTLPAVSFIKEFRQLTDNQWEDALPAFQPKSK